MKKVSWKKRASKGMRFQTLAWKDTHLELIDQTQLPWKTVYIRCRDMASVWSAIREMKVRGAPAIGVAAAFGVYLGVKDCRSGATLAFMRRFQRVARRMAEARPTAKNLTTTLDRLEELVSQNLHERPLELKRLILGEALEIMAEDEQLCQAIGRHGEKLIESGDRVLTHCNAGALATAGIGTALAAVYCAVQGGKRVTVFAPETRPFLQGARLTAWELVQNHVPVTLICDNTAGYLMEQGRIDKVVVGADRIARNGDTANKIGTYTLAELAHAHGIPFYVAAPSTTFDFSCEDGSKIPIEIRPGREMIRDFAKQVAPRGAKLFYPAFDVTPARLITGIITEKGVFRPPYRTSLAALRGEESTGTHGPQTVGNR